MYLEPEKHVFFSDNLNLSTSIGTLPFLFKKDLHLLSFRLQEEVADLMAGLLGSYIPSSCTYVLLKKNTIGPSPTVSSLD